jgi:hypothetical protein
MGVRQICTVSQCSLLRFVETPLKHDKTSANVRVQITRQKGMFRLLKEIIFIKKCLLLLHTVIESAYPVKKELRLE